MAITTSLNLRPYSPFQFRHLQLTSSKDRFQVKCIQCPLYKPKEWCAMIREIGGLSSLSLAGGARLVDSVNSAVTFVH